mgnify:CR=1 FL=1
MATESNKDIAKKPAAKKPATAKAPAKAAAKAPAKKPAAVKKPVAKKPAATADAELSPIAAAALESNNSATATTFEKPTIAKGRYVFATGRRKTAVANVRLFAGSSDNIINKKKLEVYFGQKGMQEAALRPLALTGLLGDFYFSASVKGGGSNAQSEAIRHGIAQILATMNADMKIVLKKNGFLTRDDRKKERKKPGLRRARRAPQWAKR